ncbi:MAG: hypothetical protein ABJD11_13935 [Gemmatimonadota bacterium]
MLLLAVALLAQAPRLDIRETSFGSRRVGIIAQTLTVSSAGHVAYITRAPGGEAVVLDGVLGKVYPSIPRSRLSEAGLTRSLVFSPDGQRLAYVAALAGTGPELLMSLVVDGVEGPRFARIPIGALSFSRDSRRVAYLADVERKSVAVTDSTVSMPYDQINVRAPEFTADGHVLYSARRDGRSVLVRDGREVITADYVGDPVFSATGERMAVVVNRNDAWSVIVDGAEGPPYAHLGNNLVFSRDGRRFLYRAADSLDFVVVDRAPQPGWGGIEENSYDFSPDGQHVAFVAHSEGQERWVLDGRPQAAYDWVSSAPIFDSDGGLAYVAEREGKRLVVSAEQEGRAFDDIVTFPVLSGNGRRMLYVGKRGTRQVLVADGVSAEFDQVQNAFFTPGSERLVVVARRGPRWRAFIDADSSPPFAEPVGPFAESKDGEHLAFEASRGRKRVIVADGVESRLFDDVTDLSYTANGHLVYAAKRLGKYRLYEDGADSPPYDEIISPVVEREPDVLEFVARRAGADVRVGVRLRK